MMLLLLMSGIFGFIIGIVVLEMIFNYRYKKDEKVLELENILIDLAIELGGIPLKEIDNLIEEHSVNLIEEALNNLLNCEIFYMNVNSSNDIIFFYKEEK